AKYGRNARLNLDQNYRVKGGLGISLIRLRKYSERTIADQSEETAWISQKNPFLSLPFIFYVAYRKSFKFCTGTLD
ncbi:MAG: hypothetical protein ACK5Y3_08660, partial [Pseudanabaena sp.]